MSEIFQFDKDVKDRGELPPVDKGEKASRSNLNKNLCLALVKAETRAEVKSLLTAAEFWDNPNCWQPYGGTEQNWGVVAAQSEAPDAALIEKLTNSIDAVLTGKCRLSGIEPKNFDAPEGMTFMQRAIEKFFDVKDGRISACTQIRIGELAENVKLIVTGDRYGETNYTIADKGEGQSPQKMPDTLLSLLKGNKKGVSFVQGSFNMGGTAVFAFDEGTLQLVLSRRHPDLVEAAEENAGDWGFTIVRVFSTDETGDDPELKCLAPNNKILSFPNGPLPILPSEYPILHEKHMEFGSFIKIYGYEIDVGRKKTYTTSPVSLELQKRLSFLLNRSPLPIKLFERRDFGYKLGSPDHTLIGMQRRLDNSSDVEMMLPIDLPPLLEQKISGTVYVLKEEKNVLKDLATKHQGVVFSINGQCHATESRIFFKNEAGLNYLHESMIAVLDFSNVSKAQRIKTFKSSRDRMSQASDLRILVMEELKDFLKENDELKALNNERKMAKAKAATTDNRSVIEALESLTKKSPLLRNLLGRGKGLKNPYGDGNEKEKPDLKWFPDFITPEKSFEKRKPRQLPENAKNCQFKFKTNAANDYFTRIEDPGVMQVLVDGEPYLNFSKPLSSGKMRLKLVCDPAWKQGEVKRVDVKVTDINPDTPTPFEYSFYIKIGPSAKFGGGGGGGKKDVGSNAPPEIIEVRKPNWSEHRFNEWKTVKVVSERGEDKNCQIYLNLDSRPLQAEIKERQTKTPEDLLIDRYKAGMMLFVVSLLSENEDNFRKRYGGDEDDETEMSTQITDEEISRSADLYAQVLLPTIDLSLELDG